MPTSPDSPEFRVFECSFEADFCGGRVTGHLKRHNAKVSDKHGPQGLEGWMGAKGTGT